jgi:hypothetical protein
MEHYPQVWWLTLGKGFQMFNGKNKRKTVSSGINQHFAASLENDLKNT